MNTLYLSQLMGPILLLLGASFLLNKEYYLKWFKKMEKDDSFLFLAGVVEATAGLAVVLMHNLWTTPSEIIVSLMGWAMLLEGAVVLLINRKYPRGIIGALSSGLSSFVILAGLLLLVSGGYLSSMAY